METHVCCGVSRIKWRDRIRGILIPPAEKLVGSSLPLWGLILLKEVDDELVEFFIIKSIVVTHPVGGVIERKVKLGQG